MPSRVDSLIRGINRRKRKTFMQKVKKKLKMIKTKETKYSQYIVNTKNPLTTGVVYSIISIDAGDDLDERDGNKVEIQNVRGAIRVTANVNGLAKEVQVVRAMIVKDSQHTNGTVPGWGTIMYQNQPETHMEATNKTRFKVLWDRSIRVAKTAGGIGMESNVYKIEINHKYIQHFISNVAAGLAYQALYLCLVSNEPTYPPDVTGGLQVAFKEK